MGIMGSAIETKSQNGSPVVDTDVTKDEKQGNVVELGRGFTEEEERRVLRKIDCTILPMVCFICPILFFSV
jgi:co-chaperonin GroES (HSP10)